MVLAHDFPLLGVFWTVTGIFVWVIWAITFFNVISEIFWNAEMTGAAKAGWLLLLVVLPFLGIFVYLGVRTRAVMRLELPT